MKNYLVITMCLLVSMVFSTVQAAGDPEAGKAASASCAACHQANGAGIPGVYPAIAGSAVATGDVAKHIDIGVNGVAGTSMQAFGEQLSAVDLAAVITYQRNAFGNDTGDMVQPADITAAK